MSSGGEPSWSPEPWGDVLRRPLPHLPHLIDRTLLKTGVLALRHRCIALRGLEHVDPSRDPFVFAINHNQKPEALIVPLLLIFLRGGRRIHFLSDWNFQLIPGVSLLIRRSQVITITTKSAKPRFLNVLKPLWHDPVSPFVRARRKLLEGASVGVYPEGTVNRNPRSLLAGNPGAARLSLETGTPVVPAGISFPGHDGTAPISDRERFVLEIGSPITPPTPELAGRPSRDEVRAWHHSVMHAIAAVSGKSVAEPRRPGRSADSR